MGKNKLGGAFILFINLSVFNVAIFNARFEMGPLQGGSEKILFRTKRVCLLFRQKCFWTTLYYA